MMFLRVSYPDFSHIAALPGSHKGGDCDHLLLASSPGGAGTNNTFINLRAYGGDLLFDGTHVESWDMGAGAVHEDYAGGRRCVFAPASACRCRMSQAMWRVFIGQEYFSVHLALHSPPIHPSIYPCIHETVTSAPSAR